MHIIYSVVYKVHNKFPNSMVVTLLHICSVLSIARCNLSACMHEYQRVEARLIDYLPKDSGF